MQLTKSKFVLAARVVQLDNGVTSPWRVMPIEMSTKSLPLLYDNCRQGKEALHSCFLLKRGHGIYITGWCDVSGYVNFMAKFLVIL